MIPAPPPAPVSKAEPAVPTKPIRVCPVCRWPHPSDQWCKPGEARDNGYTLTRKD